MNLDEMIAEAVCFLWENEPGQGYTVAFSGGKDSIVALDLVRTSGVRHDVVHNCTRIDPPEVYRFILTHYPDIRWNYPEKSFYAYVRRHGPPSPSCRWCCALMKEKRDPKSSRHIVVGVRAEESRKRAMRPRIYAGVGAARGTVQYKPIFSWPEWAVWEYIERRGLPYPSLYDTGYTRIGCELCPYSVVGDSESTRRRREASMSRRHGLWKAYRLAVHDWWKAQRDKAHGWVASRKNETFDMFWEGYLRNWKKPKERDNVCKDKDAGPCAGKS